MSKGRKRNISDDEVALIRAMLGRGIPKTRIQAYFSRPDRPVNFGRITNIEEGSYARDIEAATTEVLDKFLQDWEKRHAPPVTEGLPTDGETIRALFTRSPNGAIVVLLGETEQIECKQSFHLRHTGKWIKAIAGLANNSGGYLLFGVNDDEYQVCGLRDNAFRDVDAGRLNQIVSSALMPVPRFDVTTYEIEGMVVGLIYVYPHPDKPVICIKQEDGLVEGAIYFRYRGETRLIKYGELRSLLEERDKRVRQELLPALGRLMDIGGRDAAVLNKKDATIEGSRITFRIPEELIPALSFVDEGTFKEQEGSPAIRIVGDAELGDSPKTIVRARLTDDDVLRDFLNQQAVTSPLDYILHSCHTQRAWLPIFYYQGLSGLTVDEVVKQVEAQDTSRANSKLQLIARLKGEKSAYQVTKGKIKQLADRIVDGEEPPFETASEINQTCQAIFSLTEPVGEFNNLAGLILQLWSAAKNLGEPGQSLMSSIYRASFRLDELYYA